MWYAVGVVVLCGIAYIALVMWDASRSVEATPTQEMFVCDKHGPMPESATVVLFDGVPMDIEVPGTRRVRRQQIRGCALCFEDKIKQAQSGNKR